MKLSRNADKFEMQDATHDEVVELALDLQRAAEENNQRIRSEGYDEGYEDGKHEDCSDCEDKDELITEMRKQMLCVHEFQPHANPESLSPCSLGTCKCDYCSKCKVHRSRLPK